MDRFERPQDCIERLDIVKVIVSEGKEMKSSRMKESDNGFSDKSSTSRCRKKGDRPRWLA